MKTQFDKFWDKETQFDKFWDKVFIGDSHWNEKTNRDEIMALKGWNAAVKSILGLIKRTDRKLDYNWQHEDVAMLVEQIKEMVEK